jgi:hypothetical protein
MAAGRAVSGSEDVPGYIAAPAATLGYPWRHLIAGYLGRLGTRDDVAVHQHYIADVEAGARPIQIYAIYMFVTVCEGLVRPGRADGADVGRGGGAGVKITAGASGVRMWSGLSLLVED